MDASTDNSELHRLEAPSPPRFTLFQDDATLAKQLEAAIADGAGYSSPTWDTESFGSNPPSPSASSSPARPLSSSPSSPASPCELNLKTNEEKDELLGDLDHFVPVGILARCDNVWNGENVTSAWEYPELELRQLEKHNRIRTSAIKNDRFASWSAVRVYVLPDDVGRKYVPGSSPTTRRCLKVIMSKLDTSREAWNGRFDPTVRHAMRQRAEDESLFYIFNTLQQPSPEPRKVLDPFSRKAMEEVLSDLGKHAQDGGDIGVVGLKTELCPYQRRSAAYMIQKESQPGEILDPRLQEFRGPTGKTYYYDKEDGGIFGEKRLYTEPRGGILAETMGFGKTLICLSVILATRGHFPRIPSQHIQSAHQTREKTGSLLDMAAATVGRFSLPWEEYFEQWKRVGEHHEKCVAACEKHRGAYTITSPPPKYGARRKAANTKVVSTHLRLCSGTLIVVPPNLVRHWLQEIETHTHGLKVLVLEEFRAPTPPAEELLSYDIILFSRSRFEKENGGFSAAERVDYDSPLKKLHWLRIIVDEGHNFASHGKKSNAVHLLDNLHVERRWVVSGTPSSGLYGIEVPLASRDTSIAEIETLEDTASSILQSRKDSQHVIAEELKDLDKLRAIVVEFLAVKPWANSRNDDPANWTKYMKPVGEDGKRKKAPSLRATLQSLIVRHPREVVDKELPLPELRNQVVYLDPTFHDKLSLNLFIVQLTVNAVTSEREDQDYMFHTTNRTHLKRLINGLRHAGFWWTGFKREDIQTSVDTAKRYVRKNREKMSGADLGLISEAIGFAEQTLCCSSWEAFSNHDELGIFVDDFPEHARKFWAIDSRSEHQQPLLLGVSQARLAQKFVTSRLSNDDPAQGIAGAGIRAKREMQKRVEKDTPSSTEPSANGNKDSSNDKLIHRSKPETSPKKQKAVTSGHFKSLPPDSPLAKTKLIATSSAKLTYLLDKVMEFQAEEKIIIFYENNNTAFWIAEGLELLGVEFRIYANTLDARRRSEYLSLFNGSEEVRVLLMDLRQAAHGLHVACASRVFIVNPIWDPNIESQAIKRAHRRSQTKPVFVETLVLKGTLEEKMLSRRKQMTSPELQHSEKDLLDDNTMNYIIQNERFIPITEEETSARPAYLKNPPGFFDRHKLPVPDSYLEPSANQPSTSSKSYSEMSPTPSVSKRKRKILSYDGPPNVPFDPNSKRQRSGYNTPTKRRSSADNAIVTGSKCSSAQRTPARSPEPDAFLNGHNYTLTPPATVGNRADDTSNVPAPILQSPQTLLSGIEFMASAPFGFEDPYRG